MLNIQKRLTNKQTNLEAPRKRWRVQCIARRHSFLGRAKRRERTFVFWVLEPRRKKQKQKQK